MTNYDHDLLNLMLEETTYRSAAYFAEALGVSRKTIYNHSKNVQIFLEDNGLHLEKTPRKGFLIVGNSEQKQAIRLNMGNKMSTNCSNRFSPEYRRLYLFSQLLFSDRKSYRSYAESFFVSVQSIKKDFDEINAFLHSNLIGLPDKIEQIKSLTTEIKIEQVFKKYLDSYLAHSDLSQDQLFAIFGTTIVEISTRFVNDNSQQDSHVQDEYLPSSLREFLMIFFNRLKYGLRLSQIDKTGFSFDLANYKFNPNKPGNFQWQSVDDGFLMVVD